jgi:predicted nucleic acid-binding protein
MKGANNVAYVIDASIAACWCFRDEEDRRATIALDLLAIEGAIAPIQWWFEVHNVVLQGERRRRLSEADAMLFLDRLDRSQIQLAALPDADALLSLARKHHLSFYDAAYLELARRESVPLATLDKRLSEAARAEGVRLVGISE